MPLDGVIWFFLPIWSGFECRHILGTALGPCGCTVMVSHVPMFSHVTPDNVWVALYYCILLMPCGGRGCRDSFVLAVLAYGSLCMARAPWVPARVAMISYLPWFPMGGAI